jgi:hypothetical protein
MVARLRTCRLSMRFVLGTVALVVIAAAGLAGEKASIEVVDRKPQAACKSLGKVTGKSQGNPLSEAKAKEDALNQARDLGATHFMYMPEYSGQKGSYTWIYFGIPYRCPAVSGPAPAK